MAVFSELLFFFFFRSHAHVAFLYKLHVIRFPCRPSFDVLVPFISLSFQSMPTSLFSIDFHRNCLLCLSSHALEFKYLSKIGLEYQDL